MDARSLLRQAYTKNWQETNSLEYINELLWQIKTLCTESSTLTEDYIFNDLKKFMTIMENRRREY